MTERHEWVRAKCYLAERRRKGHSSLIPPNYQRVSKQCDTADLLVEGGGHDWKALPAYYDRSVMVMGRKSAPWR